MNACFCNGIQNPPTWRVFLLEWVAVLRVEWVAGLVSLQVEGFDRYVWLSWGGIRTCHDFITDMLVAAQPEDVLGVGFNIPQLIDGFKPYQAEPGSFVPEIRFGLFDLERLKALQPMANPVREGRFEWMWHRAVQHRQQQTGMRCVRGGDSRSFYVHPRNEDKANGSLPIWRDLIAQGIVPHEDRKSVV